MFKRIASSILIFAAALLAFSAPAQADEERALYEAEKFEAQGQYALAASAYLAVVENFDFMPGTQQSELLTHEQRVIVGKCAIHCLEQGIHQYLSQPVHGSLSQCPEFQLLAATADTMMRLEPHNSTWSSLHSQAQILLATHH